MKKMLVCNGAKKSATNQPFKPQPSQSCTWAWILTLARALTFLGFYQDCHHCPVVVQFMSWKCVQEILHSAGLHQGSCTTREFWKTHILSLRSFADICARLRVFALVAARWFPAVTTMDGTQKQPRNSLKQLIRSHEIPILNTRMADYVHTRFSSA